MIELIFKLLSSNWILALEDKNCQQIIRTDNFNHDGEGKIKPNFIYDLIFIFLNFDALHNYFTICPHTLFPLLEKWET